MERNRNGQFAKGHKPISGCEKGQFQIGNIPWSQLHPELMPKGENAPFYGKHHSEEAKEKLRQFNLGRKFSQESNKKKGHPKESNPNWKGGQFTSVRGYIYILIPEHPYCRKDGYVKRATLVMEQHLGRYLIPPEFVHHKKAFGDDRIECLRLCANQGEHRKLYSTLRLHAKKPKILTL